MSKIKDLQKSAFDSYVNVLTQINLMPEIMPIAMGAWAIWRRLTGNKPSMTVNPGVISFWIYMNERMADGEYPDKGYHVGQILEHLHEQLDRYDPKVTDSEDTYSHDIRFQLPGNYPNVNVYIYYGGNCGRVKVGTRMVEEAIYETRCA